MSLEVLDPGWASRVVDMGRPDWRNLGVPIGGAADRTALAIGNALVGNPPDAAGLEVCLSGPRLRATGDTACVLYGAPFEMTGPQIALSPGKTFTLQTGDELHIGGSTQGMCAYLCVRGGFEASSILGSRSALEPIRRRPLCAACAAGFASCLAQRRRFLSAGVHGKPGEQSYGASLAGRTACLAPA